MNSAAIALPVPGLRWGRYPERSEGLGARGWRRRVLPPLPLPSTLYWPGQWCRRAQAAWDQAAAWQALDAAAFAALRAPLQQALLREGLDGQAGAMALAYAAEAGRRSLGRQAYVTQLMAALALLRGHMAEMATGEGKSLAAALTAAVAALAGIPVHVLTANDYLVQRDAETFGPLYALLGLSCGWIGASHTEGQRRAGYAADVAYVTAREAAFDYLRDRLRHGTGRAPLQQRARALAGDAAARPVLRGLCMAVVDEADNILIDEALMPLLLAREVEDPAARAFLWQAWPCRAGWRRAATSASSAGRPASSCCPKAANGWPGWPRAWGRCGSTPATAPRPWAPRSPRATCCAATATTWCCHRPPAAATARPRSPSSIRSAAASPRAGAGRAACMAWWR